jgi:hypothetical protein
MPTASHRIVARPREGKSSNPSPDPNPKSQTSDPSSLFTAPVNATMRLGQSRRRGGLSGAAPAVDVQNAREVINLQGDQIKRLELRRSRLIPGDVHAGQLRRCQPTRTHGSSRPVLCRHGSFVCRCNSTSEARTGTKRFSGTSQHRPGRGWFDSASTSLTARQPNGVRLPSRSSVT